ncbi:DEAD/DEAH box helicase [Haloferacaceae archaeon DSL9]
MRIRDLPLSSPIIDHFREQGVEKLYPPQAETVEAGLCEGDNVVAAIPTASGKTLIAELAMLTVDGPALYIVPLRALAREKYESFAALPGVEAGISTGDFDSAAEDLGRYDIVVATSEKVDSAIRNGASWVERLRCVVVDEVHLLGAERRGPTLEVTIANLRRRTPDVQLVALSATVDNPDEIAAWLDATLVESTWRPIDLRTGVYADERVAFDDGTERTVAVASNAEGADHDTDATAALVADALEAGGQCLAFVRSRREAEALAERLADEDVAAARSVDDASALADELASLDGTLTGQRLADCARAGVGFHHAGLRSDHRIAVERAFRDRELAVICATPTLAAGVNVPARRVVVRDQKRYTGSEMAWLPVLEVHQMCGRAGRPHLDPYGEAILVGDDGTADELHERYVTASPEAVASKLTDPNALRTHVLSTVATGFASTRAEILDVLAATFYAHQAPNADLTDVVEDVLAELVGMGMLDRAGPDPDDAVVATDLGKQVSRQYLAPKTGARIVAGIETAAEMDEVTELTALEIVCDTPDMPETYLGNRERAAIYQFARTHASQLTTDMNAAPSFERWLEAVKTARILSEWTEGATVEELVESYRLGPGDLDTRVERAEWLLGAADALSNVAGVSMPAFDRVRTKL